VAVRRDVDRSPHHGGWRRLALAGGAVVLLLAIGLFSGLYAVLQGMHMDIDPGPGGESDIVVDEVRPGERINVLVLGVDAGVEETEQTRAVNRRRTDTMLLCSIDPDTREIGILSLPRDSRVPIPGRSQDKLCHAHAFGGPALAMEAVSEALNVPVHYFIRVDFRAFTRAVDILGGVEFDVPEDMKYDDPYQNLHIDLRRGPQLLDGDKALQLVRYRGYADGDIGRIQVQQQFIAAFISKALRLRSALKIPALVQEMVRCVDTNMEPSEMLKVAQLLARANQGEVAMGVLPGEARYVNVGGENVSYVIIDEGEARRVVDQVIRGYDVEGNSRVRVAVLNGSGEAGLASRLAAALTRQGYSVVYTGNADEFDYEDTLLVYDVSEGEVGEQRRQVELVARSIARLGLPAAVYRGGGNHLPGGVLSAGGSLAVEPGGEGSVPAVTADVVVICGKDLQGAEFDT